jgi:excinuclease ABC subunit C
MPTPDELLAKVAALPTGPGCYLYLDADGRVIYVGKAKNLRRRVASYFQREAGQLVKTLRLVQEVSDLEVIDADSEVEALLIENALIKQHQPRFNLRQKDGKDFPLLAITREEFPRIFITRDRTLAEVDTLGPFVSALDLRRAYHFLQRVFRFRVCDLDIHEADPARPAFRPCLNWHLKRCSAPCAAYIDRERYADDIRALRAFVTGRVKGEVAADLEQRMRQASAALRFEDAARLRDQLHALARLKERGRLRDYDEPSAPVLDLHTGLERLRDQLGLTAPPRVIEGFDIAHLHGRHVVAALVQFVDGVPNKDAYRRYRIRGEEGVKPGNDDTAAVHEVVGRRYRRLRDSGAALPDLVLVDGGRGQVARAQEALAAVGVRIPCLVGLAKREELVVVADGGELALGRRDPGLKLLMYVRDEAHRFCRRYFHLLEDKVLEEPASEGGNTP